MEFRSINDDWEFIWGVKSADEHSKEEANLHTLNDIDICYNKRTNKYYLGLETIYYFTNERKGQIEYLERLFQEFTRFMTNNGYDTDISDAHTLVNPYFDGYAESITELYVKLKIFIEGYKAVYGHGVEKEYVIL